MATPDWNQIPRPENDGAADHLHPDVPFPSIALPSTSGHQVDVSALPGLTILFCYPRTAAPGEVVPADWDAIPGARGCTPQACSFRDAAAVLASLGVQTVLGCSTQSTEYQRELKERTRLGYEILSDAGYALIEAMGLPTFEWEGRRLMKRLTMAVEGGKVVKVWYPVFPPDRSAEEVVQWLKGGRK